MFYQKLITWLFNNCISVFSLLISICSIYYTYKIDKRNKPNLKIEIDKRNNGILFPCDSYQGVSAQAYFNASIVNKSNSPITIYKITDGENPLANKCAPHKTGRYEHKSTSKGVTKGQQKDLSKQIILPLRLDSYDAIETIIFFPNFRKYYPGEEIELCFFTSRGTFKQSIKIELSVFTKQELRATGRQ